MVYVVFQYYLRIYKSIQRRIQSIPKSDIQFFSASKIKKIIIFFAVPISLFVSYKADNLSAKRSLISWQKNHYPAVDTWSIYLKNYQFLKVNNLKVLHKVFRSLPIQYDQSHSVWISKNKLWIGVFYPNHTTPFHLFTNIQIDIIKKKDLALLFPNKWDHLGSSWIGFNELIPILKKQPRITLGKEDKKIPKNQTTQDPREIIY